MGVNFGEGLTATERAQARTDIVDGLRRRVAEARKRHDTPPMTRAERRQKREALAEAVERADIADAKAAEAEQRAMDMMDAAEELVTMLDEATAELEALATASIGELAEVVRRFLSVRQAKYPGVQGDTNSALNEMATLSGWWPDK